MQLHAIPGETDEELEARVAAAWRAIESRGAPGSKSFDESEHPRDAHGQFTESGGGYGAHAGAVARASIIGKITSGMDAAYLPEDKRSYYMQSAKKVLAAMNEKCRTVMDQHLKSVVFYHDTVQLTQAVAPEMWEEHHEGCVSGAYKPGLHELNLDGDPPAHEPGGAATAHEVYAHEFSHALDWYEGTGREAVAAGIVTEQGLKESGMALDQHIENSISNSPAWARAAQHDIVGIDNIKDTPSGLYISVPSKPKLSAYAMSHPSEAWAEYGRLVFTKPDVAEKNYPQCWKIWKGLGYV